MSFGAEIKDFVNAYRGVKSTQEESARTDYYKALTDKTKKGPRSESDPDGVMDGLDAEGNPTPETMDTNAPHGMLWNFGKWLGLTGGDKPNPTQPMSATQKGAVEQALPVNALEASQTTYDTPDDQMNGYSRGGVVQQGRGQLDAAQDPQSFDDGGPEADAAIPTPTPRPDAGSLQARSQPEVMNDGGPEADAAIPVSETTTSSAPSTRPAVSSPDVEGDVAENMGGDMGDIGAALHAGIVNLQQHFKLDPGAGAVPDQQSVASGRKALFDSEGRAPAQDMQQLAQVVDPKGELTHSQMILRAMTKGYEHYMAKGDPQRAANFASQIIQYSTFEAAKHGDDALQALQKGDINAAAQSLKAGYDNIPDGREATDVKVNPDKTVSVTETDVKTGKPVQQHTLSPEELYGAAVGLKNKTLAWRALMAAAGSAKGYNPPESDAYTAAQAKLAGANPDGTLTDAGNQQEAVPTKPQGQGDQILTHADPNAMHMVESGNNPNAVSPKGAVGVGQTMPGTLRSPGFGVAPAKDNSPAEQQRVADDYLNALVQKFGPVDGHIAYNWGPQNMIAWKQQGGDFRRLPQETQNYLGRIAVAQAHGGQPGQQDQQPSLQPAVYRTSQPAPSAPGAQPQQQPNNPLALRPALPEDQAEAPPAEPQMTNLGQAPTPPKQVSMGDFDTANMGPKERAALLKQIVATNTANRQRFNEEMRLYQSKAQEARTQFAADRQKYQDQVKAQKPGKDPLSLPVKDRGDAIKALQEARPDPKDQADPVGKAFGTFQPTTQKIVDSLAYDLYTHNGGDPSTAYRMAVNMMVPQQLNFQPHEMANGNVRIVFRDGSKVAMSKNAFDQMAAARGNELYVTRKGKEAADKTAADRARLVDKGKKAAQATGNIAKKALGAIPTDAAQAALEGG